MTLSPQSRSPLELDALRPSAAASSAWDDELELASSPAPPAAPPQVDARQPVQQHQHRALAERQPMDMMLVEGDMCPSSADVIDDASAGSLSPLSNSFGTNSKECDSFLSLHDIYPSIADMDRNAQVPDGSVPSGGGGGGGGGDGHDQEDQSAGASGACINNNDAAAVATTNPSETSEMLEADLRAADDDLRLPAYVEYMLPFFWPNTTDLADGVEVYTQRIREALALLGGHFGPMFIGLGLFWILTRNDDPQTATASLIGGIFSIGFLFICQFPTLVYFKCTGKISPDLTDYQIAIGSVQQVIIGICVPRYPTANALQALTMAPLLVQSKRSWLHFLICWIGYSIAYYNLSEIDFNLGWGQLVTVTDMPRRGQPGENLFLVAVSFSSVLAVVVVLSLVDRNLRYHANRQLLLERLCRHVARRLDQWDVPGVLLVLERFNDAALRSNTIFPVFVSGIVKTVVEECGKYLPLEAMMMMRDRRKRKQTIRAENNSNNNANGSGAAGIVAAEASATTAEQQEQHDEEQGATATPVTMPPPTAATNPAEAQVNTPHSDWSLPSVAPTASGVTILQLEIDNFFFISQFTTEEPRVWTILNAFSAAFVDIIAAHNGIVVEIQENGTLVAMWWDGAYQPQPQPQSKRKEEEVEAATTESGTESGGCGNGGAAPTAAADAPLSSTTTTTSATSTASAAPPAPAPAAASSGQQQELPSPGHEQKMACVLACCAALHLLERAQTADHGVQLDVRIGIHHGRALVGSIGDRSQRRVFSVMGQTPTVAGALCRLLQTNFPGCSIMATNEVMDCAQQQIPIVTNENVWFATRWLSSFRLGDDTRADHKRGRDGEGKGAAQQIDGAASGRGTARTSKKALATVAVQLLGLIATGRRLPEPSNSRNDNSDSSAAESPPRPRPYRLRAEEARGRPSGERGAVSSAASIIRSCNALVHEHNAVLDSHSLQTLHALDVARSMFELGNFYDAARAYRELIAANTHQSRHRGGARSAVVQWNDRLVRQGVTLDLVYSLLSECGRVANLPPAARGAHLCLVVAGF